MELHQEWVWSFAIMLYIATVSFYSGANCEINSLVLQTSVWKRRLRLSLRKKLFDYVLFVQSVHLAKEFREKLKLKRTNC